MTEQEREEFYDREIGPVLLDLMKKCNAVGMPFIASVEYNPGCFATSADMPARSERSLPMDWAYIALRCQGNADTMIGYLIDGGRERGHGSIYLKMLNVPLQPGAE